MVLLASCNVQNPNGASNMLVVEFGGFKQKNKESEHIKSTNWKELSKYINIAPRGEGEKKN